MKIRNAWIGLGVSVGVLAGCQSPSVKFQVKDQRVPEQVGLKVETLGSFVREGVLANQPMNLPRAYLDKGELDFQLYRITNESNETIEVYPSEVEPDSQGSAELIQDFVGICPRTVVRCQLDMESKAIFPAAEQISEYVSEFDLLGSVFRFDSGGSEKVETDPSTGSPRPIQIRAGESGVWVLRFALRPGSAFIPSAPLAPGYSYVGLLFMAPGMSVDAMSSYLHQEWLAGLRWKLRTTASLLVRSPKTDELNPIYLGVTNASVTLYLDKNVPNFALAFPPPKVARRINGLAEQL